MASPIPGYQLIRKIADGGMSSVYLAIQLSVGREVALKILSPELSLDQDFIRRFYREANIIGRLKHHNILSIYDIGHHEKHYYIAMEYLPNGNLRKAIDQNQLNPEQTLAIVSDINDALQNIHQQQHLHCDIKPDNVMLRADGSAVVTDFGIARAQTDAPIVGISGTPYYMSPEQLQGRALAPSSDIYSLGVVLYEMLTGRLPFIGKDVISSAMKQINSPIPSLDSQLEIFQPLINRMMAKRPGARFQDCNEIKHALDFFEAQYLRKEKQGLPLKLRCQLLLHKAKQKVSALSLFNHRLLFSFRYGLVARLACEDIDIEDIQRISKTIEITHNSLNAQYTLYNNPIALALALNQAKVILPSWLIALLLLLGISIVSLLLNSDILLLHLNAYLDPSIIYID